MEYRLAGEEATFTIDFKVDGEFAIPDDSSVFLTVRDSSGITYPSYNKQSLSGTTTSTIQVPVDAVVQYLEDNRSPRFLTVYYKVASKQYQIDIPYVVHQFVKSTVTKAEVRDLFGAEYSELPDSAIDIISSHFSMLEEYGSTLSSAFTLPAAYTTANSALRYYTAYLLAPQMPARLLTRERNDTSEFQRSKVDFEKLEQSLYSMFQLELQKTFTLMGSTELDSSTALLDYPIFVVTTPTDPVTNA
jgi:hypothetical protein